MDTPKIYVACLASYNNSILHGEWIDADQSADDIKDEIYKMLKASPIDNAEEFAIHDYECFGPVILHEYESIDHVAQLANFITENGEIAAALLAYCDSLEEAETMLHENYRGEYDSEIDFAEQLIDDCYGDSLPDISRQYFDYESYARDLFISDFFAIHYNSKVYVFSNY